MTAAPPASQPGKARSRLSPAEMSLLGALAFIVGNTLPIEWLNPAQRSIVKRMRAKGLLGKRNPDLVTMTQKGKRACR